MNSPSEDMAAAWSAVAEDLRASYVARRRVEAATLRKRATATPSDTAATLLREAANLEEVAATALEAAPLLRAQFGDARARLTEVLVEAAATKFEPSFHLFRQRKLDAIRVLLGGKTVAKVTGARGECLVLDTRWPYAIERPIAAGYRAVLVALSAAEAALLVVEWACASASVGIERMTPDPLDEAPEHADGDVA